MNESDFVARVSPYAIPGFMKIDNESERKFRRLYRNRFDNTGNILAIICGFFSLPITDVVTKCRKRELVWPRQCYCYIAVKYTGWSLKDIGAIINGRDHTTVIHSVQAVCDLMDSDPAVRSQVETIEQYYKANVMVGKAY